MRGAQGCGIAKVSASSRGIRRSRETTSQLFLLGEFQIKWLNTKVEECCLWGYSEEAAVVSAPLLGEVFVGVQ